MKVEIAPYQLQPVEGSQLSTRRGVLLRVIFDDALSGYADCHPWPELGDAPLEAQLLLLASGRTTDLTGCSLAFARIDAKARQSRKNLFQDLEVPLSHGLMTTATSSSEKVISKLLSQGHRTLKIKMGFNIDEEADFLLHWQKTLLSMECTLRLDFNYRLSEHQFRGFLHKTRNVLPCIEFFEDPFPYHPQHWQAIREEYGIKLACDRECATALESPNACDFLVVKPAVQNTAPFLSEQRGLRPIVMTSYLDHPIGQLAAAYTAAVSMKDHPQAMSMCGLLTQHAYETTPFSERLLQNDAHLVPSLEGYGWGYDDLLEAMPWQSLT